MNRYQMKRYQIAKEVWDSFKKEQSHPDFKSFLESKIEELREKDKRVIAFNKLSDREKWAKAKTFRKVVWCCAACNDGVDDGKLPSHMFMGERFCGNCDALLTRRTGGGQNDPFNYIPRRPDAT